MIATRVSCTPKVTDATARANRAFELTPLGLPEHLRAFSGFIRGTSLNFNAFGIKFLHYLPTQAFQLSMKGLERPKDLLLDNYERTLVFGKKGQNGFSTC